VKENPGKDVVPIHLGAVPAFILATPDGRRDIRPIQEDLL
jgi:hypothetical protein